MDNDIDLSSFGQWQPIGKYEPDYEYADAEWWVHAFKGRLDGNGHAIKGLRMEGEIPFGQCGLFGALSNAEVHNLVIEKPLVNVKGAVLKGNRAEGSFHAEHVGELKEGAICGSGEVPSFEFNGMKMTYVIENCM